MSTPTLCTSAMTIMIVAGLVPPMAIAQPCAASAALDSGLREAVVNDNENSVPRIALVAPVTDRRAGAPGSPPLAGTSWTLVRSYVLKDGRLYLSLMADRGVYEFER